jgi:hypothetical protein
MSLPADLWNQVRIRANFACEYCGVTEADTGGELTVDHFRPRSRGGTDELSNLLYCCYRCNLHKGDYWPAQASDPMLWNPREEAADLHLSLLADGRLHAVSARGAFTLLCLHLNRPSLVANRLRRLHQLKAMRYLMQVGELSNGLTQLQSQCQSMLDQFGLLLQAQRKIIDLLISRFF